MAGLGHITLTVAFVFLLIGIGRAAKRAQATLTTAAPNQGELAQAR